MFQYRTISSPGSVAIEGAARAPGATLRACAALMMVAVLSGCAWFSPDAGMGVVAGIADRELNKDVAALRTPEEAAAANSAVRRLLGRTLTADAAVQVALLNNRGLQAAYNDLAKAEARQVGESLP